MSWFLFVDEPGDWQSELPYGVLSGLAVEDVQLWPLTQRLREAQRQFFGRELVDDERRYCESGALLDAKVFESAALHPEPDLQDRLPGQQRPGSDRPTNSQIAAALAQANIAYCDHALGLAGDFGAAALAMFLPSGAIRVRFDDRLRKDYGFLLERYYYFLKSRSAPSAGFIVLPRKPRGRTYVEPDAIASYFAKTTNGRVRARHIVPYPVYADGPLGIVSQLAELLSYVASWSIRLPNMTAPRRPEMGPLTARCSDLRFSYIAENGRKDWSFKYIDDLRPSTSPSRERRGVEP